MDVVHLGPVQPRPLKSPSKRPWLFVPSSGSAGGPLLWACIVDRKLTAGSMSRTRSEHLAAAQAAAARMAATAVLAGRSAAAAARSCNTSGPANFRNDVANRAMAAAALRAASKPEATLQQDTEGPRDRDPSGVNLECRVGNTDSIGQRQSQPARHARQPPQPQLRGNDPAAADSERDDARMCEWDIKVERTFINVVPLCPKLTHTASAPARLDRPFLRRRRMRPSRRRR
ncbi:unnamed protein product [Symbiodinium natans]|uniref:Uncharacterized protein n=1 Tax=Symbiodinium natans TaxID=878477 RepID=A0A812J6I3_9DINO|nr:unnamed protein product [Symbiodinium natans]